MCRIARAEFETGVTAPSAARHWVAALLEWWEIHSLVDTTSLLLSEVVTNAVRHAEGHPSVTAAIADGTLEVAVADGQPDVLPRNPDSSDQMAMGGRGLAIVDAMSADWGITALTGSKQVWFRLEATDWTYRIACRCHGDDLDKVVLDSGFQVLVNSGPWNDFEFPLRS